MTNVIKIRMLYKFKDNITIMTEKLNPYYYDYNFRILVIICNISLLLSREGMAQDLTVLCRHQPLIKIKGFVRG